MKHSHQKRPKSEAKADDGIQTPQHRWPKIEILGS